MTTTEFRRGSFDLGRVMQRTFAAISQNWLVFLVLSLLLVGVPSVISGFGQSANTVTQPFEGFLLIMIGAVLTIVGTYILQGTVVFATVKGLNGNPIDVGKALSVGVRFFFPLLGLAILMGLGIGLGFLLLIVPGLILMVIWIAAAPAVVVEKRGVMESFQRSRDLTRGSRWMIFALLVVYGVVSMIISWTVLGLGIATGGSLADTGAIWLTAVILTPLVNVLTAVVSSAGVAAIYHELRQNKEGASPDELASVFD